MIERMAAEIFIGVVVIAILVPIAYRVIKDSKKKVEAINAEDAPTEPPAA